MANQESRAVDLDELATVYDEHECRIATYHGRELTDEERLNLGIEALVAACPRWYPIEQLEQATDRVEEKLKQGETVGRAVATVLRELNSEGENHA